MNANMKTRPGLFRSWGDLAGFVLLVTLIGLAVSLIAMAISEAL